jgi:uncharacterized membrane protein HdeD (DUF308 family)
VLAALFIIEGALEIGMGFRIRPKQGWGWLLFSGIIAVAAGVLVFAGLPSTATWAIGLLVGVNLLASGLSFMLLAAAARA